MRGGARLISAARAEIGIALERHDPAIEADDGPEGVVVAPLSMRDMWQSLCHQRVGKSGAGISSSRLAHRRPRCTHRALTAAASSTAARNISAKDSSGVALELPYLVNSAFRAGGADGQRLHRR
jgi:hypothetical protein